MTAGSQTAKGSSHRFIENLKAGESLPDEVFLVSQKDLRTTTNGSLYIHIVFADRTGQVLGRMWNATQEQYDVIPEGGFIRIRARVESYKGNLQVIVDGLRPAADGEFDVGDFMPHTKCDIEEMWKQLLAIMRTIKNRHLLALVSAFIKDEVIVVGYKKAPAAVQLHHAYIGGLLEHTLSVLQLATRVLGEKDDSTSHYPKVSRDLVLAGIFLHDIAKIVELTFETNFTYSTAGQLVGHITQAAIWIDQKVGEAETATGERFPQDMQDVLTHIVLSHHGTHEFGSPRLPACPEAILVHYLDNIDAKLNIFLTHIDNAKDAESDWTEYVRSIETRVFKKDVMGIRGGD